MKNSFIFSFKLNDVQKNIIDELAYHTTKLYNILNYDFYKKGYVD